jgi:putative oxidoreductase
MTNASFSTIGLTALRIATGFIFAAHGWQKYSEFTIAGTQGAFAEMGVPMASAVAPVVAALELIGGIALILGLLSRPIAALLALDMLGALVLVHAPAGVFIANNGYELVLILAAAALGVALIGPGRISLDGALFTRTNSPLRILA